jgi:hypothetical protein
VQQPSDRCPTELAREDVADYALGTRPATPRVRAVAWLVAAWCVGFAAVNVAFETTGRFTEGAHAEYATALSVMDWTVAALKTLGATVALLSVTRRRVRVSPRLVAVLVCGAAALLGLYCFGGIVEAIGMLTGVTGDAGELTLRSVGYLSFVLVAAAGYGVLAVSFSRRYDTGRREALIGVLGAPIVLAALLVAIPLLLVSVGVMPAYR